MFDPRAADGIKASYELRLGEDIFRAVVSDGRFEIVRGDAERPDATIETDADTLAALVYDGREFAEAVRSGDVKMEGDESAVERFLTLFPLPEPAARVAGAQHRSAGPGREQSTLRRARWTVEHGSEANREGIPSITTAATQREEACWAAGRGRPRAGRGTTSVGLWLEDLCPPPEGWA